MILSIIHVFVQGKYIFSSELDTIFGTQLYLNINKKVFNEYPQALISLQKLKYFHTPHQLSTTIILDGYSMRDKCPLVYINDCRKDMPIPHPTSEDKKYENM